MSKVVGLVVGLLAICWTCSVNAQQMACGQAVSQLQSYVQQVNGYANQVYYQGIPMQCGMNTQCQYMLFQQLNSWYQQQAQMVNNWYMQIQNQCNRRQSGPAVRSTPRGGRDRAPEMEDDRINDLEVDDEDRTVRIRIPDTPRGFR